MENIYVWLFLFAGGTIAFLAMLLLGTERELKKKRRELREIQSNRSDSAVRSSGEAQVSRSSAQNHELLEKISSLSSRLEESQKVADGLRAERDQWVSANAGNQGLEETIANLRTELRASENRLNESAGQAQAMVERHAQLQAEFGELTRQHQASQTTIAELQAGQEHILLDAQTEKQQLGVENQQLQQEIANLRNQLQASETQIGANAKQYTELEQRHARLQLDVNELKPQLDHLTMKNNDLSEEKNSLSSKLASAQRTIEELQTIQQAAQSENQHLQAANDELQREIAKLKLEFQASESRLGDSNRQNQEMADRNASLQRKATDLTEQLQLTQKTIEELRVEQQRLSEVHLENQKLRQESADLREQIERSDTQLAGLSRQNQEAADHYARLNGEAAALARQLDEAQAKIRELDALQQELASAESRERVLRSRQDDQEMQLAALRRDLSAAEGRVQELDATRSRMAEMERRNQELSDENRRLEEENLRSQGRSAENQKQIDALQRRLGESQMKHAPSFDLNDDLARLSPSDFDLTHILQSAKDAGGELARKPIGSPTANPVELMPSAMAPSPAGSAVYGSGDTHATPLLRGGADVETTMENGRLSAATMQTRPKKKSRMAKISAVAVLAVAAGGGIGFLGTRYFASNDDVIEREFVSDERPLPNEAAEQTAETKPALRVQGKFKITRATEVYSGPTERSALITRIEPGMKINVVDARDGWLEIRSKYGRPPGFVREEAAVKIDQN